ncbi:DUF1761 domain-containing protein [Flavobacterium sp. TMP13]|uniref:DUF1761 domain-containing protein n=1 Tax=Flavobacterium sp. TMP13 TaxID=3425950 RepID=UPI003D78AC3E
METNLLAFPVSALFVVLIGFVWYNPKVFGTIWMRESGLTKEDLKTGNMLKIFAFTYIFALMISITLLSLTVHQTGALAMVGGVTALDSTLPSYAAFMADYGGAFRTFKHGALHGFGSGLFFAFPVVAINGLLERKSWKYIFIHAGFWTVTLTIMGAIICGWV